MEAKPLIKDLGILVDDEVRYEEQLYKAVSKAKQKAGWVLRTFSTRDVCLLRTVWRSLVQCHLDYGNILWAPYCGHGEGWKWTLLESSLREFSRKAQGLKDKNYWERLESFNLTSIQRRIERYRILYTWKSLNGLTPTLGLKWSPKVIGRSERILETPMVNGLTEGLKSLRRRTIQHEGAKLVNILPPPLRNFSGKLEIFKCLLDNFLSLVPDEPKTNLLIPNARDF